jgi:uncharacterized protein (TIGR00266 family)
MKYTIQGGQLPVVVCELDAGEEMFTESGGMSWMSDNISMSTNMDGGLLKGLGRMFTGESMFMATYKAERGPGIVAFSSSFPGSIIALDLPQGQSIICQKGAFLAASRGVTLEVHLQKKLGAGLFGGEGFIMQRVTGPGTAFFEIDGSAIEYDLQHGQVMKVSTGHVAMMKDTVNLDITMVKGFKNILFGGEGLFLTTLTGPGHIWLQSMPAQKVAQVIFPYLPISSSDKNDNK